MMEGPSQHPVKPYASGILENIICWGQNWRVALCWFLGDYRYNGIKSASQGFFLSSIGIIAEACVKNVITTWNIRDISPIGRFFETKPDLRGCFLSCVWTGDGHNVRDFAFRKILYRRHGDGQCRSGDRYCLFRRRASPTPGLSFVAASHGGPPSWSPRFVWWLFKDASGRQAGARRCDLKWFYTGNRCRVKQEAEIKNGHLSSGTWILSGTSGCQNRNKSPNRWIAFCSQRNWYCWYCREIELYGRGHPRHHKSNNKPGFSSAGISRGKDAHKQFGGFKQGNL